MSVPDEFYHEQAALCAQSAAESTLSNQREKYLRAQAAWQALADRDKNIRAVRDRREAARLAQEIAEGGTDSASSQQPSQVSPMPPVA